MTAAPTVAAAPHLAAAPPVDAARRDDGAIGYATNAASKGGA